MLLSEIIYNIDNLIAGGVRSDDENISDRQMAFIINYYRAKLIKQDQDRERLLNTMYVQNLGTVDLIQADKNECCDIDACILRTSLKIPKPLETYSKLNLTFVGTLNGRQFNRYTHNSLQWKHAAKYTAKEPAWYYQNGYIYIVDPPTEMTSVINIQGIFENPIAAQSFVTCGCEDDVENCNETFSDFEFEYPLPQHHVDTIVKMFADNELRMFMTLPADVQNDRLNQAEQRNAGGN